MFAATVGSAAGSDFKLDETNQPMASVESGGRSVFSTSSAPHAGQGQESAKHTAALTYMHRPPRIMPNYGRKTRGALPKSNVSRVLLYDNVTQQQMLQVKISHLHVEKRKAGHLLDLHRKSFIIRRLQTQKHVGENPERGTYHLHLRKEPQLSFTHAKASSLCLDAHNSGAERPEVTSFTKHDDISVETEEKLRQDPDVRKLAQKDEECSSHRGLPVSAVSQDRQTSGSGVLRKSPDHAHRLKRRNQAHVSSYGFQNLHRDDAGTIKLPDISRRFAAASGETGSVGHVLLTSDSSSYGVTRVLHTFPARVDQKGGKALANAGRRTVSPQTVTDDRYRRLVRLLVRLDRPSEGYLELSPSFQSSRQDGGDPQLLHTSSLIRRAATQVTSRVLTPIGLSSL